MWVAIGRGRLDRSIVQPCGNGAGVTIGIGQGSRYDYLKVPCPTPESRDSRSYFTLSVLFKIVRDRVDLHDMVLVLALVGNHLTL